MPFLTRSPSAAPRNLGEMLLRDVASLLTTSQLVGRWLKALRPQCTFSPGLAGTLDNLLAASDAGETLLQSPLDDASAELPAAPDESEGTLLTDFFARLPVRVTPGTIAADMTRNLGLLARHIELKARLTAEEALLAGQESLGDALMSWSAQWRRCGGALQGITHELRTGLAAAGGSA